MRKVVDHLASSSVGIIVFLRFVAGVVAPGSCSRRDDVEGFAGLQPVVRLRETAGSSRHVRATVHTTRGQCLHMLRGPGEGSAERRAQLADAAVAMRQELEHGAPRAVRQGVEHGVQPIVL
jgi:hypothetical protein